MSRKPTRSTRLRLTACEDRTVPTVVINGTSGDDTITSQYTYDQPTQTGTADILVNGVIAYSFAGDAYTTPDISIFLPDRLVVNGLGGNDAIDLGHIRSTLTFDGPVGDGLIIVHGGPGDDTIKGSFGADTLYGDAGADRLDGGVDEDVLVGDVGDAAFDGGGGNDQLRLDAFAGTLRATADFLSMNGNKLTAADGNFAGIASFDITASNGDDTIDLDESPAYLVFVTGRGGDDVIRVNATSGRLDGGNGNDTIASVSPYAGGVTIVGGNGDNRVVVFAGGGIDGGDGDDFIDARGITAESYYSVNVTGGAGNDVLFGGQGADVLDGGKGTDKLVGGGGDNQIDGGPGADELIGGPENDLFAADPDDARWAGGGGLDTLTVNGGVRTAFVTNTTATIDGRAFPATGLELISLTGTAKNDTLDAGKFSGIASLYGLGGNDRLTAGAGEGGTLDGGVGNDTLTGGADFDVLFGDAGIDRLTGNGGDDVLYADVTDTLISAGAGVDYVSISGGAKSAVVTNTSVVVNGVSYGNVAAEVLVLDDTAGNDTADASAYSGNFQFFGTDGNDFVRAGSGGSYLFGGAGNDTLIGGVGSDYLAGDAGADSLVAGNGDDGLYADVDDTTVFAGDGTDGVTLFAGTTTVVTATTLELDGRLLTTGGIEDLTVYAPDSDGEPAINDTIDASAYPGTLTVWDVYGDNVIRTGSAGSTIYAYYGDNTITGGAGNDLILATDGTNVIDAGGGDNRIETSVGSTVAGGPGTDVVSFGSVSGTLTVTDTEVTFADISTPFTDVERLDVRVYDEFVTPENPDSLSAPDTLDATGFSGFLWVSTFGGNDTILVGSGGSEVYLTNYHPTGSTVVGGSGNDYIVGGFGPTVLSGGDGNDTLVGGFGNDALDGGAGDDVVSGGYGNDTLVGGTGLDTLTGGSLADTFYRDADDAVYADERLLWDLNENEGDQELAG